MICLTSLYWLSDTPDQLQINNSHNAAWKYTNTFILIYIPMQFQTDNY